MTRDEVFAHCLGLPSAVEDYPFGDEVAVFKVGGKMFAIVSLEGSPSITLDRPLLRPGRQQPHQSRTGAARRIHRFT